MEEKALEIIERASQVFMRLGIKSVTMDDVAREMSISKKTLYKYFKDKNELVNTIIELKLQMDEHACCVVKVEAENAIDELIRISQFVMENFQSVNPTVFHDLQKYHPESWAKVQEHKWGFIYKTMSANIDRGIKEGIYRDNINNDIISKLYVASTDLILEGKTFPWPEYKFHELYDEIIRFQIRGLANEKGINYLKTKLYQE